MYNECAILYDTPTRDLFSRQCARLCRKVFPGLSINPPAPVVDLACGTGLLCQCLHNDGYSVTGVDISSQMLELATARDYGASGQPELLQHDIRTFRRPDGFKAVLCFGDVLNHLLDTSDLVQLFESAYRSLQPGGVFLADTTTLVAYRSALWNVSEMRDTRQGFEIVTRSSFDETEGLGWLEVQASGAAGNKTETMRQRYHTEAVVQGLLEEAGFTRVLRQDFDPLPDFITVRPLKNIWMALKERP